MTIISSLIYRAIKILRPFLQFMIYALAIYIALTRVSDYRHHPGDVMAGTILGNVFAVLILIFVVDLFQRPRSFHDANYPYRIKNEALHEQVIEQWDC